MADESDADLAGRAARGDNAEFETLVHRYQNAVYEMSCRMLGDRDAGLDAAQEVFIRAHGALDRYDPTRKFSTWILAITRNHCIDQIRRPARRLSTRIEEEGRIPDLHAASPRQQVEDAQTSTLLARAVAQLPEAYREAVELYHYQDLTYVEAAQIQGVPLGTYMARLHRARKKLRDLLRPVLGDDDERSLDRGDDRRAGRGA
jgi:RNA polymerase sigma-70 factor (ECF subfamily)